MFRKCQLKQKQEQRQQQQQDGALSGFVKAGEKWIRDADFSAMCHLLKTERGGFLVLLPS